jgi:hypothetical protein
MGSQPTDQDPRPTSSCPAKPRASMHKFSSSANTQKPSDIPEVLNVIVIDDESPTPDPTTPTRKKLSAPPWARIQVPGWLNHPSIQLVLVQLAVHICPTRALPVCRKGLLLVRGVTAKLYPKLQEISKSAKVDCTIIFTCCSREMREMGRRHNYKRWKAMRFRKLLATSPICTSSRLVKKDPRLVNGRQIDFRGYHHAVTWDMF